MKQWYCGLVWGDSCTLLSSNAERVIGSFCVRHLGIVFYDSKSNEGNSSNLKKAMHGKLGGLERRKHQGPVEATSII